MAKYVKMYSIQFEYDPPLLPHVVVDEQAPQWSGLYDADGVPLCKLPNPIGFGRDDEW
jgi:hypothetical protein